MGYFFYHSFGFGSVSIPDEAPSQDQASKPQTDDKRASVGFLGRASLYVDPSKFVDETGADIRRPLPHAR